MTAVRNKRRLLLGASLGVLLALAVLWGARLVVTGWVIGLLLQSAGASQASFQVTQASPWQVVLEDIGFQMRAQTFAAKRVAFARNHWWVPSLGKVRVEQARIPLTIDGSDTNPWSWAAYDNNQTPVEPWQVPLDELSVDGKLVVQAAALPAQELSVQVNARLTPQKIWEGRVQATGPGLAVAGELTYDMAKDAVDFQLPAVSLDLQDWQAFVRRLVVLPGGQWELAGKFAGSAEGRLAGKKLTSRGALHLREGRAAHPQGTVVAEGIEADLEFTDLAEVVTKPGALRIREVRTGQLALRDLEAELALAGTNKIAVSRVSFKALGGTVSRPSPSTISRTAANWRPSCWWTASTSRKSWRLTRDLPAKGESAGWTVRFPLRLDDSGVRLGTGWLQLKPGVHAEIQFNATGLLTGGAAPSSPSYAVLKKVESGLLKLKVSELRLDIRPPNAPAGRTARLHLAGAPVDPDVKAPVILDLNVNGPLEKLINLGLDSRLSFGSKP
jgi:hypothetical protein